MKRTLLLIYCILTSSCWQLFAQPDTIQRVRRIPPHDLSYVKTLQKLDEYLSPDWIIQMNGDTIQLTYCRSCKEAWWQKEDSINLALTNHADSGILHQDDFWMISTNRPPSEYLTQETIDSIAYFGWLNPPYQYGHPDRAYQKEQYAPTGILEIKILPMRSLRQEDADSAHRVNELLWSTFNAEVKSQFGCTPCQHSHCDMRNCRLTEASPQERRIVNSVNHVLVKEPYYSEALECYTYYFASMPSNNLNIVLCDKQDNDYFLKRKNFIKHEVYSATQVIFDVFELSVE